MAVQNTDPLLISKPATWKSGDLHTSQHHDDTVRWPVWKTLWFVISVCLAFWGGLAFLALSFF